MRGCSCSCLLWSKLAAVFRCHVIAQGSMPALQRIAGVAVVAAALFLSAHELNSEVVGNAHGGARWWIEQAGGAGGGSSGVAATARAAKTRGFQEPKPGSGTKAKPSPRNQPKNQVGSAFGTNGTKTMVGNTAPAPPSMAFASNCAASPAAAESTCQSCRRSSCAAPTRPFSLPPRLSIFIFSNAFVPSVTPCGPPGRGRCAVRVQ